MHGDNRPSPSSTGAPRPAPAPGPSWAEKGHKGPSAPAPAMPTTPVSEAPSERSGQRDPDEGRVTAATDATHRAAREWFGYGCWTAPYWFVGMEPGGEGDGASHESWYRRGGGELIDCRAHHLDCGFTRWHEADRPATQPTWRRVIQLLLSYKGEDTNLDAVARYQRDRLGAIGDETAVLELSAHHAVNIDVDVARTQYREERMALISRRMREYKPAFVVFYGRTYKAEYERVVGQPFGGDGSVWRDGTLCVLTPHPVAKSGPPPTYWISLGAAMRSAVDAGAGAPLAVADAGR